MVCLTMTRQSPQIRWGISPLGTYTQESPSGMVPILTSHEGLTLR